jgi:transposase
MDTSGSATKSVAKSSTSAESPTKAVPATRRIRTLEEKLKILAEAARPGASVATVARRHDLNANVLFAWRRLQHRGLLESRRHAPPLLPVKITSPTLTPTQRAHPSVAPRSEVTARSGGEDVVEIVFDDVAARIRLHGAARDRLMSQILERLTRR